MDIQPFLKPAGHRDHLECFTAWVQARSAARPAPSARAGACGLCPWRTCGFSTASITMWPRPCKSWSGGVSAPAAEGVKVTDRDGGADFSTNPGRWRYPSYSWARARRNSGNIAFGNWGTIELALAALRIAADREVEALQWVMMVRYRRLRAWSEARGLKRVLLRLRGGFQ